MFFKELNLALHIRSPKVGEHGLEWSTDGLEVDVKWSVV